MCSTMLLYSQLLDQVSRQPEEGDFSDGQEYYNRGKNRYPDKLPCKLLFISVVHKAGIEHEVRTYSSRQHMSDTSKTNWRVWL